MSVIVPIKDYIITSPFGMRTINGRAQFHCGVDLVSKSDTSVYAPVSGVILAIDFETTMGNYILLETENFLHRFLHLEKILVMKSQRVKQGDKIAIYGNTGYSFGAHLHWDILFKRQNRYINPSDVVKL